MFDDDDDADDDETATAAVAAAARLPLLFELIDLKLVFATAIHNNKQQSHKIKTKTTTQRETTRTTKTTTINYNNIKNMSKHQLIESEDQVVSQSTRAYVEIAKCFEAVIEMSSNISRLFL